MKIAGIIIGILIIAGGAFWGGTVYGKSHAATAARGAFTGTFTGVAGGGFRRTGAAGGAGGGITTGKIIDVAAGSVTLQLTNSSSTQIVLLSNTTPISKMVSGSVSDLSVGTTVIVTGSSNSDGSLSASSVQIRPAGAPAVGAPSSSTNTQ